MTSERMWVKVHHSRTGEVVVAICDEDLLGKTIKVDDDFSIEVSEAFYGGVLVAKDELDRYIKQAGILNLLGENTIACMEEKGLVSRKAVIKIGNIPHVQLYL